MLAGFLKNMAWLTGPALISAGLIFFFRMVNIAMDTLRVLFGFRGRKGIVWVFGFLESLIFVMVISATLKDVTNPLNLIGYSAGFATGNVIGMLIENKLALGFTDLRIVSSRRGAQIAESLRRSGYGVTEIGGRGRDGAVNLISSSVLRKQTSAFVRQVHEIDPDAFITSSNVSAVRRGFWRI